MRLVRRPNAICSERIFLTAIRAITELVDMFLSLNNANPVSTISPLIQPSPSPVPSPYLSQAFRSELTKSDANIRAPSAQAILNMFPGLWEACYNTDPRFAPRPLSRHELFTSV